MRFLRLCALLLVSCIPALAQQLMPHNYPGTVLSEPSLVHAYSFRDTGSSVTDIAALRSASITALLLTISGSAVTGQVAYDPNRTGITGIKFVAGSKATSTGASSPAFEWNTPFTVEATITNLQAARTGSACVGVVSKLEGTNGCPIYGQAVNGWTMYLFWNGSSTVPCFEVDGSRTGSSWTFTQVCSNTNLPNGYTYQLTATYAGTGSASDITLYVNGIQQTSVSTSAANTGNFGGAASTVVTSGGAGYANSFAVTYTGGGCVTEPTGTATASSGVVASVVQTTFGYGCSSAPTPVFTAGGGTGAAATVTVNGASLINTASVIVGDRAANFGTYTYVLGGVSLYSAALPLGSVVRHFASLDWYWTVLPPVPASPTLVIHDNDFCADVDGDVALHIFFRLAQLGYIKPIGLIVTEAAANSAQGSGQYVELYAERAGLTAVPIGVLQNANAGVGWGCNTVNPQLTTAPTKNASSYQSSLSVYRSALANAPGGVKIITGGPLTSLAALFNSPADGISALTGQALIAAKVAGVYTQGADYPSRSAADYNLFTDTSSAATLLAPTGGLAALVPHTFYGFTEGLVGNPAGSLQIYPSTSILYKTWNTFSPGADTRSTWDVDAVLHVVLPSLFTTSASSSVGYASGTGLNTWTGTASNQFSTQLNVPTLIFQSLVGSLMFTDVARPSVQ